MKKPHLRRICAVHELPPGSRRVVEISDEEEVLILNVDGIVYAISNICPHAGAALQRGQIVGGTLYCPLHRWGFALATGTCDEDRTQNARVYTMQQQDGDFFLQIP